jgi:hypothetical protein
VLCELHFTPESFHSYLRIQLGYYTHKRLLSEAIPTIPAMKAECTGSKRDGSDILQPSGVPTKRLRAEHEFEVARVSTIIFFSSKQLYLYLINTV